MFRDWRILPARVSDALPRKTNSTSLLALVTGVFGFCVPGLGGVLPIALGVLARAQIRRSDGRESGQGLAATGIALGGLHCLALIACLTLLASRGLESLQQAPTLVAPPSSPPKRSRQVNPMPPPPAKALESIESVTRENLLGRVTIVDLRAGPGAFRAELTAQATLASQSTQKPLLYLAARDCLPCNGFMLSLRDPRLQQSLAQVRLIRVEIAQFPSELRELGLPLDNTPGFALLSGPDLRIVDYVHGGEWDEDIADNIAPVMAAFVRGAYTRRRHVRPELLRPGETRL